MLVYPAGSELGFGEGSVRALYTVMVYVNGPAVAFVDVSFTVTLNETVAAEVGGPLTVRVAPLSE
jgi:hypothetical protein